MHKKKFLDLKPRREIYQLISENPGLYIQQISGRIKIPRSTLVYHLRYLVKSNLINVKSDGILKRFYNCDLVGARDQELLSLLRQKTLFRIIMYLYIPRYFTKKDLAKDLNLHPTTVDAPIKKLLDMDVIKPVEVKGVKNGRFIYDGKKWNDVLKKPVGREILYTWKNQNVIKDVYRLLITYKESMIDPEIIEAFADYVEQSNNLLERKIHKKYLSFDLTVDNFIEIMEDIFHSPFHF